MNSNRDRTPTVEVGEENFQSEVLNCNQPVLVVFWAPWSQPCRILEPVLDEVAIACAGCAKVAKISADDNPDLSLWYEIQSIPTLLYFVDGGPRVRLVGTASKEAILAKLQTILHEANSASSTPDANKPNAPRNL